MTSAPRGGLPGQYLSFFLGQEEYGAGILEVREIVQCEALTRVPGMPPCVRGVMNLRGSVVPVIDLGNRFGYGSQELTARSCVVVVERGGAVRGLLCDAVSQVFELGAEDIKPVPEFGTKARPELLLGLGRAEGRFVLLLDLERVLSEEELLAIAPPPAPLAEAAVSGEPAGGKEPVAEAGEGAPGEAKPEPPPAST